MMSAHQALALVQARRARIQAHPGSAYAWLPNQESFRRSPTKTKMIRQGNQWGGKSTVALEEMLCHLRGAHPYFEVPEPPVEWWVMCAEAGQSIAIQKKLYDLLGVGELHPDCEFHPVRGFVGRSPVFQHSNGSICRIKTTAQRTISLAGSTIDGVLFDEPPMSQRLFVEVSKRTIARDGWVLLSLTPANAGPLDWLSEMVEAGLIEDHHARLTPEALIPPGHTQPICLPTGQVCDAAWVEKIIDTTPSHERPVACHGEWEYRAVDRMFSAWRPDLYTVDGPPDGEVELRLGIDYGTKIGKQSAVLVALKAGIRDEVWILDETPRTEHSTLEDDAEAILSMLRRNGLTWADLDEASGDRAYERGAQHKSNRDLHRQIARLLSMPSINCRPSIRTAKRGIRSGGRYTVDQGVRYLHRAQVSGRYWVHRRCKSHLEALDKWDGRQAQSRQTAGTLYVDTDYKDSIDAVRYALESRIFAPARERVAQPVRFHR